jgi:hypothetical protein
MSSVQTPVSDMLVTVKSREVQRGMLAEMAGQKEKARQHFLAAAHLEMVLASDYEQAGDFELARRSRTSAASCFWRAGDAGQARPIFDALIQEAPDREQEIQEVIQDLQGN